MTNGETSLSAATTRALVSSYLEVINLGLAEAPAWTLQRPMVEVAEKLLGERPIEIIVEANGQNRSQIALDCHTVAIQGGRFGYLHFGAPNHDDGLRWRVDRVHLENVVHDSDDYVRSVFWVPLDWLVSRMAADARPWA